MLRLYNEDTFCRDTYRLRYDVSDFYSSVFITDDEKHDVGPLAIRSWKSLDQRQIQIQSQSQVIDGRWRSGRRVWRCPWGGKFSEKPGQSGLFFRPIRNHKDMHLDSGLEWYWRGLTWMTVDYCCVPPSLPAHHIRTLQWDEETFKTFIIWSLNWEEKRFFREEEEFCQMTMKWRMLLIGVAGGKIHAQGARKKALSF